MQKPQPPTFQTPQPSTYPAIHVDIDRKIDVVDPRIYSGFTEHMGRCIYGGIYDPGNKLSDPKTGFRLDVLEVLKTLDMPLVRYPGGNFVSTYRWQDGIGPKESRPRRPELAWLSEESNQFGTDEFMLWCKTLGTEPYLCFNMGTGSLEDALAWVEYCNSSANTYYANLRRKNGHEAPYNVKYWSLGNEVWGPWQIGQQEATDYAKKAYQWAKAIRLLDPSIKLISCGETGYADWDRITLKTLAPVVDFHSIHLYTVSEGKHDVNVMGPAAAEKALEITKSLIDLAKIENNLCKELTVCFDEWNVWDPVRAPGERGAEERYDLSDALAVAAWLNVFVRKADIVKIACIAQSINVISPIVTSPEGLYRQTTYYPLHLFSTYMRGTSLDLTVLSSSYTGPTVPSFVQSLTAHTSPPTRLTKLIDASAVLAPHGTHVRLALLNRSATQSFDIPVRFADGAHGPRVEHGCEVEIHEVWHNDLKAGNSFEDEKVRTRTRKEVFTGTYHLKANSFQIIIFPLVQY
ncbi:glycoside hydrolase family 51 protein [Ramaria rubella]|nr:glycoside hydrolase family 51 protein [Ramaria rubella]